MEACIEIVTYDWTNARVKAIRTAGMSGIMFLKTPVDIAIASDFCELAQKNYNQDQLQFYFDIDLNSSVWTGCCAT